METSENIKKKKSTFREYAEALGMAILIAFVLRSFVVEAFKIPSGSMIPNLLIGDHLFVNKFVYGFRVPFTHHWLYRFRIPESGESIVFAFPNDNSKDFIKRVIGVPGDKVLVSGDDIWVNGERIQRTPVKIKGPTKDNKYLQVTKPKNLDEKRRYRIPFFKGWKQYNISLETLRDQKYFVQYDRFISYGEQEVIVPEGHLFVMGDNRDNSSDSRDWGFVPIDSVKGRAMFIWLSINYRQKSIRWDRIGQWIN